MKKENKLKENKIIVEHILETILKQVTPFILSSEHARESPGPRPEQSQRRPETAGTGPGPGPGPGPDRWPGPGPTRRTRRTSSGLWVIKHAFYGKKGDAPSPRADASTSTITVCDTYAQKLTRQKPEPGSKFSHRAGCY